MPREAWHPGCRDERPALQSFGPVPTIEFIVWAQLEPRLLGDGAARAPYGGGSATAGPALSGRVVGSPSGCMPLRRTHTRSGGDRFGANFSLVAHDPLGDARIVKRWFARVPASGGTGGCRATPTRAGSSRSKTPNVTIRSRSCGLSGVSYSGRAWTAAMTSR